jgi:hypothetical protein
MVNLTKVFGAQRDRYAKAQGTLDAIESLIFIGDDAEVWRFMRENTREFFRVIYECLDGTRRDMIGRQGVHRSAQDGQIKGIGHAMACEEKLNLSFWTGAHGDKVNTGAGKGYRTLKASGILALKVRGTVVLTQRGREVIAAEGKL